jgi:phage gp16-like protein
MTPARRTPEQRRRRDLAAIHASVKQIGLDRETYVAVVKRITGAESSKDLDARQRGRLLDELRRLGAKAIDKAVDRERFKRVWAGRPGELDQVPQLQKIEAILADAKREWAYAHGLAEKMFKVQRVEWLRPDQLHKLIAALAIDQRRRSKRTQETG